MKDLSNYFSDWIHVTWTPIIVNTVDIVFIDQQINKVDYWCEDNIGIRGLMWDRGEKIIPYGKNQASLTRRGWSTTFYRFKKEEDAMLFVLTHGGKVYKDQ